MKKYTAVIQARLESTRLPGKILKKIGKIPVIEFLIRRLSKSNKISKIIVATTSDPKDDLLCKYLVDKKINFFRGSAKNVLERYYKCAIKFKLKDIIRITSDCPLIDIKILEEVLLKYESENLEYVCNTLPPTFPDGLDVEVFSFNTLKKTFDNTKKKTQFRACHTIHEK